MPGSAHEGHGAKDGKRTVFEALWVMCHRRLIRVGFGSHHVARTEWGVAQSRSGARVATQYLQIVNKR